jgi:hypothetical protein
VLKPQPFTTLHHGFGTLIREGRTRTVLSLQDDDPVTDLLEDAMRIARACVETDPKRRPRMQEVYRTLVSGFHVIALFILCSCVPCFCST